MPMEPVIALAVDAALRDHAVPGLVLAVARGHDAPDVLALGADAAGRALTPDTLFPVASITKLATALAVLRLAADGALGIDDPLALHLPDAVAARGDGGSAEVVTLRMLLSHTAGLPADVAPECAPYAPGLDWPTLARACLATPLRAAPRTIVRYSNVGPGLLAIVVERRTGRPIADALAALVLAPLGIEATLGAEPPRAPVVLTGELGEHAGTPLEPYNSAFWRSLGLPWGGMVTTAAGALALARAFHAATTPAAIGATTAPAGSAPSAAPFLPADLLADASRDQTDDLGGGLFPPFWWPRCPWGLGVELRGAKAPHWTSAQASPGSFGHVGASGCLAWCDPAAGVSWAICGARTFERWWRAWPAIGDAILAGDDGANGGVR